MYRVLAVALAVVLSSWSRAAEPVSPDLYVGGWQVNHEFDKVTDKCMETLRTKKVLVMGMSYSLSTVNGIADLGKLDKKYALNTAKKTDITPEDFAAPVFLRSDKTQRYPYTLRVEVLDGLIRKEGYDKVLDGAFVVWHNMSTDGIEEARSSKMAGVRKVYDVYSATFDRLRKDYPRLTMIYCLPGILPTKETPNQMPQHYGNVQTVFFNSMISDNYLGEVPIYDMESFLNTDAQDKQHLVPFDLSKHEARAITIWFRGIDLPKQCDLPAMCEDYVAGDRLHGWNKVGSPRFGKAILLTMAKAYCPEAFPRPEYPQKTLPKYPATILKLSFDGLLEDASGNKLAVALGKGRSGVPQPVTDKDVFASTGVLGGCLSLQKLKDIYPVVADHELLNGMEKLHVTVHAKRFKGYGWGALLYKQDQFELRLFDGEVIGFLRTTKGRVALRGKAPQDSEWHRYELDYDGQRTKVLVDGTAVCEQPLTGPVHCTPHPLFIGKKGPFGYAFDGDLDELELK